MKTTAIKTAALLLLAALSCYANADDTQDLRNIYITAFCQTSRI
ncbi:hypothetical protein [Xylanibacter brevis]|nr:hypothetical protein [Xylanibacter brevis]